LFVLSGTSVEVVVVVVRRVTASRMNGARSHGPETLEGKRRSGQNALRHGFLSDCVVLQCESREAFEDVLSEHIQRFAPRDGVEFGLIEEMASSSWRLRRLWAIENSILDESLAAEPAGDDFSRIAAAFRKLAGAPELTLIHRYETRLHMMYQRALHNILVLRSAGIPNEPSPISGQLELDCASSIDTTGESPTPDPALPGGEPGMDQ